MVSESTVSSPLYEQVAEQVAALIRSGHYRVEEKIPGTRQLATDYGVSINTILQAQKLLENWGLVAARQRSGFYVKTQSKAPLELKAENRAALKPVLVRRQRLTLDHIQASGGRARWQLGTALTNECYLPTSQLKRLAGKLVRSDDDLFGRYEISLGLTRLRQTLAARMAGWGCAVDANDILITNGCHEAILVALKSVAKAGDIVLVESPSYYALVQILDSLGLKSIAIPSHPETGVSLKKIAQACARWPVKACVLVSNFATPMGTQPGDEQKRALLSLLAQYEVPLIEDDIFSDLGYSGKRPSTYKKFDSNDNVIYCNSFSKTVGPGLRVGWLASNRYVERAAYQKFAQNIATSSFNQRLLDEFLRRGNIDKHLRGLRRAFAGNVSQAIELIHRYFPAGTNTSRPEGGYMLWAKLPAGYDTAVLYQQALAKNIFIAPGKLFLNDRQYERFIRINCAQPLVSVLQPALLQLAQLLEDLATE